MALSFKEKEKRVMRITEIAAEAKSVVVVDYRGLSVGQLELLRVAGRGKNVLTMVSRNTLARIGLKGTSFENVVPVLAGPSLLLFSQEDPASAARIVRDFMKENEALTVRGLSIGQDLLEPSALKAIASLPSRDEALAKLAGTVQAPVSQLVRTTKEPVAQLVRVLSAVAKQKEAA